MATLPVVLSSSLLVLLGCGLCLAVAKSAAAERRLRAYQARRHLLERSARALVEASRRSSDAVLAALDANLRELDGALDVVMVFTPGGEELACVHASGPRAEHFRRLCFRRDDGERLPARAAAAGCRIALSNGERALLPTDRAAVAVPLLDAGALKAVVYASSADAGALRDCDAVVRAVADAAAPLAIALEREADRLDATYDGLTGVLTPRAFRRRLHEEIASLRSGTLSLWFVDTDHFKRVNDEFGHRAGDGVLVAMASLLRAHAVDGVDLVARNGGDEFCALLRGATKSAAIERAARFCEAVRAYDFGLPLRVTASVGVAAFPYDAAASSDLLEAADAAMYHSKREGRDRVAFVVERGRCAIFER
ncbi:MAG TPA: GGDEF domain-containing protein [Verrucomicrobiae bacterium]|nr:GGDEF domain-containing protein [Verrucomicrobiae bacterium]